MTGTASTVRGYENSRRSIYQPIYRSAVYDVLTAFDFPDPATANGDRSESIVAPQALLMMNSPLVENNARRLADQLLARRDDDAELLDSLYWKLLSRPPRAEELDAVLAFLEGANGADERREQWLSVCRAVMASSEFLYLE